MRAEVLIEGDHWWLLLPWDDGGRGDGGCGIVLHTWLLVEALSILVVDRTAIAVHSRCVQVLIGLLIEGDRLLIQLSGLTPLAIFGLCHILGGGESH